MQTPVFTFETTHHALWAEELAQEHGVPAEVIPAPAAARARCNLALQVLSADVRRTAELLGAEGVPFALYPPEDASTRSS